MQTIDVNGNAWTIQRLLGHRLHDRPRCSPGAAAILPSQTLILTQGSRGGFLWENGREVRYPVFPVHTVDSNGAGGTFHGAFLAARLKGMSVYDACRFASAASALKCTRFGAQQGIPTCDEVQHFLKTHEGVIVRE